MKLCRFQLLDSTKGQAGAAGAQVFSGIVENETVFEIRGELTGSRERTGRKFAASEVKFLPPAVPTKIVGVGRNYREHAAEFNNPVPKEPIIFLKPPSAIIAPGDPIVLTPLSQRVEYEGEIAVVIGKRCFHVGQNEDVNQYILGYTPLNDVTARDLQRADVQWIRAKAFDTFCPFGPLLETDPVTPNTKVETLVNGETKQSATVADLIFSIEFLIRWITACMTLEPGDVIATGTPGGVGPIVAGDNVEVRISGVGTLRNPVVAPKN
jgi:2-keto-4-pentenoate hydratase/2-oxohepta-3-ene-1,7-dioic acid hydratase in catechol pathway